MVKFAEKFLNMMTLNDSEEEATEEFDEEYDEVTEEADEDDSDVEIYDRVILNSDTIQENQVIY